MDFDELKVINEKKLREYLLKQDKGNVNVNKEIIIHKKIKEILENNPGIFFQIPMEDALKILSKLVAEDELKEVYTSLIKPGKYEELRKKFQV